MASSSSTKLPETLKFKRIVEAARGKIRGTILFDGEEIKWSADAGGRITTIPVQEIEAIQWSPLGRECRLRIYMIGDAQAAFRGFAAADFNLIRPYCDQKYHKKVEVLEINTTGHNYGDIDFKGNVLRHTLNNKCTFEIPLSAVSQSVIQGKHEISLLFHEDDTTGQEEEVLTEMRIYVPPKEDLEDDEVTALELLNEQIIDRAGIRVNASDSISKLESIMFTTPRGKYDIEFYKSFFKLHGSSFNYKILYQHVVRLMMMESHDKNHHYFIVNLEPPIRQGRTSYPYLIMQLKSEEKITIENNIDESELENNTLISQSMAGPIKDIVWRLFKFLSKRSVTVPGKDFVSVQNTSCISCSLKANFGHLYFFKKSFFFIMKPPTYIRHDQISTVEFERLKNSGTGRVFDIVLTMRDDTNYTFTNIDKNEFRNVFTWMKERQIRIGNIDESAEIAKRSRGRAGARDINFRHDAYKEALGDDDDEDEDEDEDYEQKSDDDEDEDESEDDSEASGDDEVNQHIRKKKSIRSKDDGDDEKVSSKGKSSKSPKRPKRARNAFTFFSSATRKKVEEENPEAKFVEVGKLLGERWKALSEEEKKPFMDKANEDKERYQKEKAQFDEENPGEAGSKRKRKDKNAPKRAKSAFMLFVQKRRKTVKEENPNLKFGEISKLMGEKWKELPDDEKKEFLNAAKNDKIRAEKEKEKYDEEHKDDDDDSPKRKKKRKKAPGEPKRPLSAYMFFAKNNRASIVGENPGKQPKEIMSLVAEKWRALDDDDKKEFNDLAKKDKTRYKEEMAAFKKKSQSDNPSDTSMKVEEETDDDEEED
eukprot:CAMPEP_0114505740 /NCGR_PEP_ID=MMETSP0109-20121206/11022_1 /TAXON_ID=29199 /ORGANISM="Chlorarachnion reptans, Strain CCCM449" /LENGTH=819 /DNA_ID=CAMNT_0001684215 /DNA_START=201 /DNA_END=2660 /DNA_ORIENTATION=+